MSACGRSGNVWTYGKSLRYKHDQRRNKDYLEAYRQKPQVAVSPGSSLPILTSRLSEKGHCWQTREAYETSEEVGQSQGEKNPFQFCFDLIECFWSPLNWLEGGLPVAALNFALAFSFSCGYDLKCGLFLGRIWRCLRRINLVRTGNDQLERLCVLGILRLGQKMSFFIAMTGDIS